MNVQSECDNLDAFLTDDLPADVASQFSAHLLQCDGCREATRQQAWINRVLQSDLSATLEPAPDTLHETIRTSIARHRQTARLAACGLAAAAAAIVIVAIGWTVKLNRQSTEVAIHGTNIAGDDTIDESNAVDPPPNGSPSPRATFVSNGDAIVVPVESPADNVSVVQLYPTTETERRWRRELAMQSNITSNGG
jgi:hypothetical protein